MKLSVRFNSWMSAEDVEKVNALLKAHDKLETEPKPNSTELYVKNSYQTRRMNIEDLLKIGCEFTVVGQDVNDGHDFVRLIERLELAVEKAFDREKDFNARCNVHVANGMLLEMNEVKVALDCCTEALQGQLNEGWRILAVCVQPDGRRPDYVLGRKSKEES